MLAADKLQLQSHVKQQATALKEKEFNLHHSNLMTVGTQAAVLAGLDITMFIEFHPAPDSEWMTSTSHKLMFLLPRILKCFYYIIIVSAFCANILVVAQTTVLSVMGASLALRGPDGSMMTATNGIYEERVIVFKTFGYGLLATLVSVLLCVWLICSWEASFVCNVCSMGTIYIMMKHFKRIRRKFNYNEEDTVDFTDLFQAGSGYAVPGGGGNDSKNYRRMKNKSPSRQRNRRKRKDSDDGRNMNNWSSDEDEDIEVPDYSYDEEDDMYYSQSSHARKRRSRRSSDDSEGDEYNRSRQSEDDYRGNNRRGNRGPKERNVMLDVV